MGISSLGLGSSILTQDVLDQLRKNDEKGRVTPVSLAIADEEDKKDALSLIDANMTNLIDSINEVKSHTLFDEREATVNGSSVDVVATANSDVQEFTLEVINLATKQIEQSDAFVSRDDLIANAAGSINININGEDLTIDYDETTTLDDFKKAINDVAGAKVDATIVQIDSDEFRLFISSEDTGNPQNITITDTAGNLKGTSLTSSLTSIQTGTNADIKFNGQDITRKSNNITDLINGLDITLREVGSSNVSITQDRETIMEKIDSFVEKYNSAITELNKMTKASIDSTTRGIFSSESTIKGMKNSIADMLATIGGGVAYMSDYGFDVDKDGKLSIDKDIINDKLDENPANVEAFLAGGTYINDDFSTVELAGTFGELSAKIEQYTKYNATLDQLKNSITQTIDNLQDRMETVTDRLDSKYGILQKQFAAFDLIITKFNSASSMFTQMSYANNSN